MNLKNGVPKIITNFKKISIIRFKVRNKHHKSLNVSVNNISIPLFPTVSFLGITLDSEISWTEHVGRVSKKLNKCYFIINTLKHCVNNQLLITAFG